jgi:hypothetical protein
MTGAVAAEPNDSDDGWRRGSMIGLSCRWALNGNGSQRSWVSDSCPMGNSRPAWVPCILVVNEGTPDAVIISLDSAQSRRRNHGSTTLLNEHRRRALSSRKAG